MTRGSFIITNNTKQYNYTLLNDSHIERVKEYLKANMIFNQFINGSLGKELILEKVKNVDFEFYLDFDTNNFEYSVCTYDGKDFIRGPKENLI